MLLNNFKERCSYISIRTFSYSARPKDLVLLDRFFRSGKWCKGKTFFLNHQIFLQDFSNFFFQNLAFVFEAKAVAKVRQDFLFSKSFCKNFQKFFRTFSLRFEGVFLSQSGCKGSDIFRFSKSFRHFFQPVFALFLTMADYQKFSKMAIS